MKKLSIVVLTFLLMIVMQSFAQTKTVEFADTVGNSQSKTFTVDVEPTLDSLKVSLFALGEIDVDSLDVKFGITTPRFEYQSYRQEVVYLGSTNTTYSKTLTINLAAAASSYTTAVTTIPKSALAGYNQIQFTVISAASGNDPTDSGQKLVVIVDKY